ncbi:hypothetical protein AVEN_198913-1 [Araneus ventricosus]|uniref:Zinc finger BED domain-containing protein 5 n=1 Tax=Araneus ventricosus TaxID=182803 RepID=A0A4Y2MPH2_ARAVE|nr:hypothetical protein AVEN_198913-1 [Araneus ventricosus]
MDKWLKTGTLERSASRTAILTTDLAAMEITVDQQDDNHEVQRPTDCPVQVDESSDVSDLLTLLVIARYLNVNELEENLLLCYPHTNRCTGEDIFNAIQGYFCENEMDWAKCCGVCTDGGKSMSGCYKALRDQVSDGGRSKERNYTNAEAVSLAKITTILYEQKHIVDQPMVNFSRLQTEAYIVR